MKGLTIMPCQGAMKEGISFSMMAAKNGLALLGSEVGGYAPVHRVRGEIKEYRDLVLYALWERGVFRNEENGQAFGLSYWAVSHIVRDVKEQIMKALWVGSNANRVNSQFEM